MLCNFGNCFGMCDAGIGNFKIFPNGQIYPCGFLTSNEKYCIGNIKEGVDIRKAKLIAMSNFDKTDPKCKGCTIRDFCHGMNADILNLSIHSAKTFLSLEIFVVLNWNKKAVIITPPCLVYLTTK